MHLCITTVNRKNTTENISIYLILQYLVWEKKKNLHLIVQLLKKTFMEVHEKLTAEAPCAYLSLSVKPTNCHYLVREHAVPRLKIYTHKNSNSLVSGLNKKRSNLRKSTARDVEVRPLLA